MMPLIYALIINFWFYQNETSSISVRKHNLFNFQKFKKQRIYAASSVNTLLKSSVFTLLAA